ncbi:MAG TPA: SAM-dependent methyltransferase, partial [Thermomicrobiales bacterium]|nr:SAM-dependent methyltransferase [Thermomicrobiales bacterium]
MPHRLTIVGLGPGDPSLRSIAAQQALDAASTIILRTAIHPGLAELDGDARVSTCDDLYESVSSFSALYPAITERVIGLLQDQDLVYAVPGNPVAGELTVVQLRAAAHSSG